MGNPTLDGVSVFGAAVQMATGNNPRGQQQNAYCGLNGLESLDLGMRGRFTTVSGRIYGGPNGTIGDFASAREALRAYDDGNTHTLVDTTGTTWLNVYLLDFQPQGRVEWFAQLGYSQRYTARILHLT